VTGWAASIGPMTTIAPTPPSNGNSGIVPPWLRNPITILPMPDGWQQAPTLEAKLPRGTTVKVGS
jgi:hypothetical protein